MLYRPHLLVLLLLISFGCSSKKAQPEINNLKVDTLPYHQILFQEVMPIEDFNDVRVSTERFYSGKKSLQIGSNLEFSFGFKKQIGELPHYKDIDSVEINLMYLCLQQLKELKVVWTIDDEKGKNLFWSGSLLENHKLNEWAKLSLHFKINPDLISPKNRLNIYIWNPGKEALWVDDFEYKLSGKILTQLPNLSVGSNFYFDFENTNQLWNSEKITKANSRSGKYCCNLSDGAEYGIGVRKYFHEFGHQIIKKLSASIWVYPTEKNHDLVLTFSSVDSKTGKVKFWQGKSTFNGDFPLNQWTVLNSAVNLPTEIFNINDAIDVTIWNKGKTAVLCDDLHIVYGGENEKNFTSNVDAKNIPNSPFLKPKLLQELGTNVSILKSFIPSNQLIHGLFYKADYGLESILHIKKNEAELLYLDPKLNALTSIWQTKDKDNFLLNQNNYFHAGDFDGDNNGDLLVVNKQSQSWQIYQFESNNWVIKIKGEQIFPVEFLIHSSVVNHVGDSKLDVILSIVQGKIKALQLLNRKWEIKDLSANKIPIAKDDMLLNWNDKSYLKFNASWRFDLKELKVIDNNYELTSTIDFKKNTKGINPKYYEFTKVITGNFLNKNQKNVLVIYLNCNNQNQLESNCAELEQNKDFPNGVGIYE